MSTAIKVENLSKIYRLGEIGTGTISRDIERWYARLRGKEDPFLKIGEDNDRTKKTKNGIVYSLQDVNFEIPQGSAVGIIGRNGAGKSTLLKVISRITSPTTGRINVKGRIASLLEVGTGFHPELTGKENIYLNGAILGMSKKEINRKLEEIIDFSGVESYIDTPVKRYSSGMYVRLAFAVAAHLESEILIVDEVLAVGDAEFQKKCLGKMSEVTKGEGRTVLFVSHNMASIKDLCSETILFENGRLSAFGGTNEIIKKYLNRSIPLTDKNSYIKDRSIRRGNGEVRINNISINNAGKLIDISEKITIKIKADIVKSINELFFTMIFKNPDMGGEPIALIENINLVSKGVNINNPSFDFEVTIAANTLRSGSYPLYFWLGTHRIIGDNYAYDVIDDLYSIEIISKDTIDTGEGSNGFVNLSCQIKV